MSSTGEQAADEVCANCDNPEVDNIKFKDCDDCDLVKYCSVECQKSHRPQHKRACKKRAAEIRDDDLFTQPDESYLGECPLCCLPLPLDAKKSIVNSCCCKIICKGCSHAKKTREMEQRLEQRCAFCREPLPKNQEEVHQNLTKRVKANDPLALFQLGKKRKDEGDYEGAFEYYTKAAEFGNMIAHYNLANMYRNEEGVELDKKRELYHLEEAAIGGHPDARHDLGVYEWRNGRFERGAKHFTITAKLGYDKSLEAVKVGFAQGIVSKEDFEAALRGHQAAVDATKSQQREEAHTYFNLGNPPRRVG